MHMHNLYKLSFEVGYSKYEILGLMELLIYDLFLPIFENSCYLQKSEAVRGYPTIKRLF